MTDASTRRPLVAGNWKMHGTRPGNAALLAGLMAQSRGGCEVLVCPPAVYLADAVAVLAGSGMAVGAQDVSAEVQGAYTGEVAAPMLADIGCTHAIVGHSERRTLHGETDAQVAAKAGRALDAGLVPIVCVGETLAERDAGQTDAVVHRQLAVVIAALGDRMGRTVVAYEPVWAIGTGRTATPEQAQAVHAAIRAQLAAASAAHVRVLYGGSVKADNAAALFAMPDVDGSLVGGASLKAGEFAAICRAAG